MGFTLVICFTCSSGCIFFTTILLWRLILKPASYRFLQHAVRRTVVTMDEYCSVTRQDISQIKDTPHAGPTCEKCLLSKLGYLPISFYLSNYPCIYLSINLSIYLSIYLTIYQPFFIYLRMSIQWARIRNLEERVTRIDYLIHKNKGRYY